MPSIELTDEQAKHICGALENEVTCLCAAIAEVVRLCGEDHPDAACHRHSRSILREVINLLEAER